MMASFKVEGLDDLRTKIKTIERKAPDRILNKLDRMGNKLKREIKEEMPEKTGNLKKGVKALPVEKIKGGYQKGISNESKHFHLVEKGHKIITKSGEDTGRVVLGKFYLEKAVKRNESKRIKSLKKWLDKLFEELK